MIRSMRIFVVSGLLFTTSLGAFAQSLPDGVEHVTTVEGVEEYRLDNGLKVLLIPDNSTSKVKVNIVYHVGSRHEGYGETGMAHLLEHLLFKGTPNHPNIPQELSDHGGKANGTTYFDRTNYYETFPSSKENIAWALELEADRMVNSFVAKKDLDSEMTVVRNEYESGENSSLRVMIKRMLSVGYDWHNYGNSTIGARSDIEDVPIERLQDFYRRYYRPDNATLIVAGSFDQGFVLDKVEEYYGDIKVKNASKVYPTYTKEPTQDGEKSVVIRRNGERRVLCSSYHIPAASHPDTAALQVASTLLTDNPSGLLFKQLVRDGEATGLMEYLFLGKEPGFSMFFVTLDKDESFEDSQNKLITLVESIDAGEVTEELVESAKQRLLNQSENSFENVSSLSGELTEWEAAGDWRLFFLNRDRIEKVNPQDVVRVMRKYYLHSNRTLGYFVPEENSRRAEIPSDDTLEKALKNYKGKDLNFAQQEFSTDLSWLASHTEVKSFADGKIRLAELEQPSRGERVTLVITGRYANLEALEQSGLSPILLSTTGELLSLANERYDVEQLQEELTRLNSSISSSSGLLSTSLNISTKRENLAEVLELVELTFASPRFSQEKLLELKRRWLASLSGEKKEPKKLLSRQMKRTMSPYGEKDPRRTLTLEEEIAQVEALKLSEVERAYKDWVRPAQFEVAVVGDFDKKELEDWVSGSLVKFLHSGAYQRSAKPYFEVPSKEHIIHVPDKANAIFRAKMNLPVGLDAKDAPALHLGDYILGRGFLNSRLATRIRQQEGLSYGVGSGLYLSSMDPIGEWGLYAIVNPENMKKLEKAMQQEVERLANEGMTQAELEAAKNGILEQYKVSRAERSSLVGDMATALYNGKDFKWDEQYEQRLRETTLAEVNVALKKYLRWQDFSIFEAGSLE